jgi:hypothetical protein
MSKFAEVPIWSGIAEGYKNENSTYVSDLILPTVQVDSELFKADYYPVDQLLVAPDNQVGRLDRPQKLDFQAMQRDFSTIDYGYDAPLPNYDVQRAEQQRTGGQSQFNPEDYTVIATDAVNDLRREIRTANLVFNPATYLSTQRQTLAGSSRWSDPTSRPVDQLTTAMDVMLIRPNRLVLSRNSWTSLSRHPQVVEAVKGTAAREGLASAQQVAELLEIERIVIGDSWRSMAESQDFNRSTATLNRLWGPHAALLHVNPNIKAASGSNMYTFGFRARFGQKKAGRIPDPNMGVRGGQWIRVFEHCREIVSANFCGYFFENVVSPAAALSINNFM